ncbi:universal stress protein [Thermaurantimonas aggregans]|uniref:universal stress protein n=1 Tax=Thermaurantimonas aggregans TaxID=2173829 RepID=UPI0023F28FE2|nr:universal stress protein [Thermaurantimonas aggregans]MCX8147655.1 universal stress protein [Thermaurantimonas aggregans]
MKPIKILIPSDFSIQSEYAYILVKKLEEKLPVEIHFIHVLNTPETVTIDDSGKITTCGDIAPAFVQKQYDLAVQKFEEFKKRIGGYVHTHIRSGKITEGIISFAEKNNFDLIAMGTKGVEGLRDKIGGTETQLVVRKSKVPVLSLSCNRSQLEIKNILFVHDFLAEEDFDISLMKRIREAFQCKIHLLHILTSRSKTHESQELKKKMESFAKENQLENYSINVLKDTDVEHGVFHFDQMHSMDIICLGTHGKGSLFYSSVAEKLINHMYKPFITFRLYEK